jgi:hypothetical protein
MIPRLAAALRAHGLKPHVFPSSKLLVWHDPCQGIQTLAVEERNQRVTIAWNVSGEWDTPGPSSIVTCCRSEFAQLVRWMIPRIVFSCRLPHSAATRQADPQFPVILELEDG